MRSNNNGETIEIVTFAMVPENSFMYILYIYANAIRKKIDHTNNTKNS